MVIEGELAAVTADGTDCPQLQALVPVLHRIRDAFGMEFVFVGELRDGSLAARHTGELGVFEESYARGLLQSRCGASAYAAIPVTNDEGWAAGTLVCDIPATDASSEPPSSLKSVSRLLAGAMRKLKSQGDTALQMA
jgi:hypothetical protein